MGNTRPLHFLQLATRTFFYFPPPQTLQLPHCGDTAPTPESEHPPLPPPCPSGPICRARLDITYSENILLAAKAWIDKTSPHTMGPTHGIFKIHKTDGSSTAMWYNQSTGGGGLRVHVCVCAHACTCTCARVFSNHPVSSGRKGALVISVFRMPGQAGYL